MKTYKHLYPQVYDFENLYQAFRQARRGGKRKRESVAAFEVNLEANLWRLHGELKSRTYEPGPYHNFYVRERKRRLVSAAPFRDRVVHHALCRVVQPIFDARFIHDSYACRVGKGTHRAVDRCQEFARRCAYVLPGDVEQFFPAIDHAILRDLIARRVRDDGVLWLVDRILANGAGVLHRTLRVAGEYEMRYFPGDDLFAAARPRGLPIGNLTSQLWANTYLDPLDQFVKHTLRCRSYLRYCDDFLLFSDDKSELWHWREAIITFSRSLRLTLHEPRSQVSRTQDGVDWLGWRVFPYYRRIRKGNARAFTRRLRRFCAAYQAGLIELDDVTASVAGWISHAETGQTYRLRQQLFQAVAV